MEPLTGRSPRDQNRLPALFAVSTTDGVTVVPLEANPSTGALLVETGTAGGAIVAGNKADNSGVPGSTNLGVLPGVANAAAPTRTEGDQVLLSTDLAGNTRTLPTGNVAAGSADSGNPIKVGAVFNSTFPTYTSGQRGDLQILSRGDLAVSLWSNGSGPATMQTPSDGRGSVQSLTSLSLPHLYNNSTFDRQRANVTGALIAAGATTTQTVTLTTYNARALTLVVNVSAYASGTINLAVNGVTSSNYTYSLLSSITGLVATGTSVYRIGIGLTPSAGLVANDVLPRTVQVVVSGTFSATYGIDYVLGV